MQNVGAYFFTKQCIAFRNYRRELRQHEATFVSNLNTFSDEKGAAAATLAGEDESRTYSSFETEAAHHLSSSSARSYATLIGALENRLSGLETTFAEIERVSGALCSVVH
jgi:hypothetical protein